jgi:uncharacterized protein (DUF433 family)
MNLGLEAIPVPLRDDGQGGLRVGQTRVSLESVWHLYQQGANPAEIVQAFDTLDAADVCAVLAWPLRHPEEVTTYLKRRDEEAAQIRRQLEDAGVTPTREEGAKLKEKLMERWHDRNTMTGFASARLKAGQPMPGVFVVDQQASLGRVLNDLEVMAAASEMDEWQDQIIFVPL